MKYLEEENKENRQLLNNQSKQLENFQILLLNEQKKNKLLEESIEQDLDEAKKKSAITTEIKLSFWRRWFKKS